MKISTEELDGGITKVVLDGRLDIEGAAAVDLKMNIVAEAASFCCSTCNRLLFLVPWGCGRLLCLPRR